MSSASGDSKPNWRCRFWGNRPWGSTARICIHALIFTLVYQWTMRLTVGLMGNLIGDMGGSEITDLSGRKYLSFVILLSVPMGLSTSWMFVAPLALSWATFFEFLRQWNSWWRASVVVFLGWLLITGLVYSALTYFATQDIAGYVAGHWEGTHSAVYAAVMRPILQGLIDGIGPAYVLGYSLQWATLLTALIAIPWWWLHRQRAASPREGAARE